MNKCARCNLAVYPVEKLSCLDKLWHKGCFKCTKCNLALNMKNYKGYEKMPYCSTHYPTQKFTTVTDTPENKRLAQLTQNISNVNYHRQFNEERKQSRGSIEINNNPQRFEKNVNYNTNEVRANKEQEQSRSTRINAQQVLPQAPLQRLPSHSPSPPQVRKQEAVKYRCLYDYIATDDDEVSFVEGDIIICGEIIDQGWMTGTVERTGHQGMLPFNYVELM